MLVPGSPPRWLWASWDRCLALVGQPIDRLHQLNLPTVGPASYRHPRVGPLEAAGKRRCAASSRVACARPPVESTSACVRRC
jgi:hypothetical protein